MYNKNVGKNTKMCIRDRPKTHEYTMKRLRKFIEEHPYVNVLRFTTFFHQFTQMCIRDSFIPGIRKAVEEAQDTITAYTVTPEGLTPFPLSLIHI